MHSASESQSPLQTGQGELVEHPSVPESHTPPTCHCPSKPLLVVEPSLVNLTLMIPLVDVQLLLEETEEPLSFASSDDEPHDVAPLDDSQLYTYT